MPVRPRVNQRVGHEVVQRLPQAHRIGRDVRKIRRDLGFHARSGERRCSHDLTEESSNIDPLESNRRQRSVDDHSLDAATSGNRQARELEPSGTIEALIRERLGNRRKRGDGAPNLVDEHCEPLRIVGRRHVARSESRAKAHVAVSRRIGSSPEWRSTLGIRSLLPTFPAAIRAFRRSQRASFLGT